MRDTLTRGLAQLGLSADAVPQLEAYASLLLEKNKVMNLTAITEPQDVATLHLLDCAALLRLLAQLAPEATCTLELMQDRPSLRWLEEQELLLE